MDIKVNILNSNIQIPQELIDAAGGDELIARIFFNRGYKNPETIRQMLQEDIYIPTEANEFPGMKNAVDRILKALELQENIAVYGDYDVDGVTSTVTLVQCLGMFSSRVMYHVPDRFSEGYGMNEGVIRNLASNGVSLIITCDCGISNVNEIAVAKELGMDVIITDHHNLPDKLPAADAILNPKLLEAGHKARNLSGCGMAYFLCKALLEHFNMPEKADEFLDVLALSLVADVVSLNGENRYLLKKALPRLFNTKRIGLTELFSIIERDNKMQNEEDIAFQIAPRINAAGRMESARLPVELFLNGNPVLACEMAQKIDILNRERKRIQQQIVEQAKELVEDRKKNKTILVLFNEYWHHGIIGIAAGKICETYKRPAILLTMKEDGNTVVGSARSTDEIDIYEMIKACSGKLQKFGGHAQAAGLSLSKDNLEGFTTEIERQAESKYFIKDIMKVDVDKELIIDEIDELLYDRLCSAGPYGEGFEQPFFSARRVSVVSDRKTEKNHHIMVLAGEGYDTRIQAVKWFGENVNLQDKVFDIVFKVGKNAYRGNSQLQLTIEHFIEADGNTARVFDGRLTDGRNKCINEILKEYKDILVFYEGLNLASPVEGTADRFSLRRAQNLVFLSTPANTSVFREAISLVNPKNIIINFTAAQDYSFKGFVLNLMGILKYIINSEKGSIILEKLAVKMCIEENILVAALNYLKAMGKINYFLDDSIEEVVVNRSEREPSRDAFMLEKNLRNALAEKQAYQQFLMKLEIEKFREYLK